MGKYTYFILNFTFFFPLLILAIILYGRLLKRQFKFIFASAILGVIYFIATDFIAIKFAAWTINYSKTIGVGYKGVVLEELIWIVAVFIYVSIAIEVMIASRPDKVSNIGIED